MNDFTKEELQLIAECVEADFYQTNWSRKMYEPLMLKIQSMIDTHCEHHGAFPSMHQYTRLECPKCGKDDI